MSVPPDPDLAVRDLRWVVELGTERLEGLLTPDEARACQHMLELGGSVAALFARLSTRRRRALRVAELSERVEEVDQLVEVGLLAEGAPWGPRLLASRKAELQALCRVRGVHPVGRRAELVQRLLGVEPVPVTQRWVYRHRAPLVARLERAAFLQRHPDRGRLVAERLGHLSFVDYPPTGGPVLWRDREHLLAWERLLGDLQGETLSPGQALVARGRGLASAPGRLSLERRVDKAVRAHADDLRRQGAPTEALAWLDALRIVRDDPSAVSLARSRLLEDLGRPHAALALLDAARETSSGPPRLAVHRSGRRLARSLRRAWIPDPPLRQPRERRLALGAAEADHRPRWVTPEGPAHVEAAVQALLARQGRRALRAEGGLLRTLFALLLGEALFLPVPDQLPVRRLDGPLDLGSPAFAARRPEAIFAALDAIAAGQSERLIRASCARFQGRQVRGISRDLSEPEPWVAAAGALGPDGLRALLHPLLARGWRATRGVPDLLLLPGPAVRLDAAHPSRLAEQACLVEVKGPGDTLSDAQRTWIDHLVRHDVPVEVWRVAPP